MGGFFYGDGSMDPFEFYAPAGPYNLAATNRAAKLEVYQPGINIVSTGNPGTVTLDASALPQDTFTFGLDGLSRFDGLDLHAGILWRLYAAFGEWSGDLCRPCRDLYPGGLNPRS